MGRQSWKKLIGRSTYLNGYCRWSKLKEIDRKTDPPKWADKAGRDWSTN
ncbi:uncharacterized protein G2W53_018440 [Senna tora]|uniref:Uncharacterized protein n=1 Tax=Senna tora TaxID=362788 RepID=A0A834TV09_9FABA|nr:uncharacterized protein G2W53_018440 [Senna tora]